MPFDSTETRHSEVESLLQESYDAAKGDYAKATADVMKRINRMRDETKKLDYLWFFAEIGINQRMTMIAAASRIQIKQPIIETPTTNISRAKGIVPPQETPRRGIEGMVSVSQAAANRFLDMKFTDLKGDEKPLREFRKKELIILADRFEGRAKGVLKNVEAFRALAAPLPDDDSCVGDFWTDDDKADALRKRIYG